MSQLSNFCYIPFHGFCIDPGGFLSYCCMDNVTATDKANTKRVYEPKHIEEVEDLQEWWETAYEPVWETYVKNEQDSLNPCYRCFSKDAMKGKRPVKASYDDNLKNGKIKWEFDFSSPKVKFLEYTVSNICNQMCVMCSGRCSTQWHDFDEQFGRQKGKLTRISDKSVQKIKKLVPNLNVIFVKGGEPFADTKNMEILEHVAETNPNCLINMTSNIQSISRKHFKILKKLKNLRIHASIDGVDEVYNWIRGGDFKKTVENAEKIYYECGHKIQPATTISIYNFFSLNKIVDYFNNKSYVKWQHCYNVVEWPNWSSIMHFPENIFKKTMACNKNALSKYQNITLGNLFKVENKFDQNVMKQSKKYTETMNSIRGFDITDYVPELKKLFNH
tara:strand:+ start:898 stop:2064 length:1167 start_codon:yes stop_codon:yes gene_type:complete